MENVEQVNNTLAHFGVRGMRWGVRRERGPEGTVTNQIKSKTSKAKQRTESRQAKAKEEFSEDYKVSRALKARGTKALSNKELKDLTQRLQLEKQLKDLSPKARNRGLNVVKSITAAGTTLASFYALSKTPLAQDIVKAVQRRAG